VSEIQNALSHKRGEAAGADRCLSSDIYLSLFCHLYTLALLVMSRHDLSMQADRSVVHFKYHILHHVSHVQELVSFSLLFSAWSLA
jgi:hypothetical protein